MKEVTTGRYKDTTGILNGIDMREWDPSNDPHILPVSYAADAPAGKKEAKAALQRELGLQVFEG